MTEKTKLIDLANELSQIRDTLTDLDLDQDTIDDTVEGLTIPFEQKAVALQSFSVMLEGMADVAKLEEKRIAARRKAIESRVTGIRRYIFESMKRAQIKKIETPAMKLQIVPSKDRVVIDAASLIPVTYMRFPDPPPPEPDKELIWKDLKGGVEIPGAHLEPLAYLKVT